MCQLISTGVRTDKGFKKVHLNQVAKALHEFSSIEWRMKWIRVVKLRELSGALWDEDNFMITLEDEHYKGHIKAHPKDAEYLNKPIENNEQMMIIFGNGMATGKYAMGSNEALGSPSDYSDPALKTEILDDGKPFKDADGMAKVFGDAPRGFDPAVGSKRKRSMLSEEDTILLTNMTDAVNNVADAIRATKVDDVHPDLYGAVMYMLGFIEEALIIAFSHLVDNKAQGTAFVGISEAYCVLWLRTFLTKHYYNV
ncbi:hypothetical protein BS78_02G126200 [Paspalum vaginatum]|nr:hypothetical protein BS78_02G126200 [Paspalum vaginatum]